MYCISVPVDLIYKEDLIKTTDFSKKWNLLFIISIIIENRALCCVALFVMFFI